MSLNSADSNLGRVSFLRASAFGELPSPFDRATARLTSSGLVAAKETAASDELRSDRMVADLAEVAFTSGGELGYEMSLGGTWDDFLESALSGTYGATPLNATGALVVVAAARTFTLVGAFNGAIEGQWFYAAGFTNSENNGWHKIETVTSNDEVIVETTTLVDETAPGTASVKGKTLRNGVIKRDYAIEQFFTDVNEAQLYLGQRLGTAAMALTAGEIVTGTWGFQGTSVQVQTGPYTGTVSPPTTTPVVNATSNVAQLRVQGSTIDCRIQALAWNLDNALRNQMAVGNKFPCGIGYGRQMIEGNLTAYFADRTLYDLMLSHADVALSFALSDPLGNSMHVEFPRIKFATSDPNLPGIDQDVMESIDWQAIANTKNTHQIQIDIASV